MDSWVAIDFETANGSRASACSVAVARVKGGQVTEQFATLIRPPAGHDRFEYRNTQIHGIQASDVVDAPGWRHVWGHLGEFIGDDPLVAHNASFDTSVIRAANSAAGLPWPAMRYACTMVIAKQTWPMRSYRLPDVALAAGVDLTRHHEAASDTLAAAGILVAQQRAHGVDGIEALLRSARVEWGRIYEGGYDTCRRK
jgi:DNA polymerase-3 subunit epsilon